VLFPLRLTLLLTSHLLFFIVFFTVKLLGPAGAAKLRLEQRLIKFLCGMYVASFTGVVKFHGPQPMPGNGHVWVANHTSMIDYVILSSYSPFAVIMQLHPGWVGFLQTQVLDSLNCLWFNRTQVRGWVRGRAAACALVCGVCQCLPVSAQDARARPVHLPATTCTTHHPRPPSHHRPATTAHHRTTRTPPPPRAHHHHHHHHHHHQAKDRSLVAQRMADHVHSTGTTPLLIFPEGTCVNNEYCVMFKRGAFELGATVHPVAIKYNKIFVDAFWNSKRQSFTQHLFKLMSSWAVVCDV
jgi:hypothetical protein